MTVRVPVRPELLRWACERSAKQPDDLEGKFPKLAAWFSGEVKPTLKQLEAFAKATYTPIGFMFLAQPPDEQLPIPDLRTMHSNRPIRPSVDLLDTIYACERRQEWFRFYARTEGLDPVPFVGSATVDDDIVQTAQHVSKTLGFTVSDRASASSWHAARTRFVRAAESAGVLVMISGIVGLNTRRKLDPREFRGFALVDEYAPLVFINGADTKAAQMFTLAHELAHIWLGEAALSDIEPGDVSSHRVERWCNAVAAELLVPLSELRTRFRGHRDVFEEVRRLAGVFKVSKLVVIRRLADVGAVSEQRMWGIYRAEVERLSGLSSSNGSGGNFYPTQVARLGRRFTQALVHSTRSGRTLYKEAYRLSGCRKQSTFNALAETVGMGAGWGT